MPETAAFTLVPDWTCEVLSPTSTEARGPAASAHFGAIGSASAVADSMAWFAREGYL